jgi:hypothetical protein
VKVVNIVVEPAEFTDDGYISRIALFVGGERYGTEVVGKGYSRENAEDNAAWALAQALSGVVEN